MVLETYKEQTKDTPWASLGRDTVLRRVGQSLLPVGHVQFEPERPKAGEPVPAISSSDPDFEKYLINIIGTAFQAGEGKLVTCAHVVDAIQNENRRGYILTRIIEGNVCAFVVWPFEKTIRYIDPRIEKVNQLVDLAVICVAYPDDAPPYYDVPGIAWGDSTDLGVGDPVVLGGYPYGTELFRVTQTNRGVIQPTFYPGIISAIIPATQPTETRLLQISVAIAGGMSGGVVLDPKTGVVLGMVTSGLEGPDGALHPVSYAIPSEVIAPFASSLCFNADVRRIGVEAPLKSDGRPLRRDP